MRHSFFAAACALAFIAGLALAADKGTAPTTTTTTVTTEQKNGPPDGWITTKVKLSLWTTAGIRSNAVSVDTNDREVTLYGKVNSPEARNLAEKTARDVDGVRRVQNLLQIVPASTEKQIGKSDDALKSSVELAFKNDPALRDSHIKVKSVDNGVVLLGGDSKSMGEHLRAVQLADRIEGVKRVSSEIMGNEDFSYADKTFYQTGEKPKEHNSADDMRITSAAKLKLLTTKDVPSTRINVDTTDGEVTLFGVVPTEAARSAAAGAVRDINGVANVKDELQVVAKSDEKRVEAQDGDIDRGLDSAYSNRPELKDVHHTTHAGVVRLTGSVDNGWARLLAVRLARATAGVKSVEQDLKVALVTPKNVR
jgi:osmotically-inducible protein OsmY